MHLLRQHVEFRKRVIGEQLLHLRVHTHGKLFKSLLQGYLREEVKRISERRASPPHTEGEWVVAAVLYPLVVFSSGTHIIYG